MGSLAQSVGSTRNVEIEDEAISAFRDPAGSIEYDNDGYKTPEDAALPYCGVIYNPECDDETLQPSLGMVFDTLQDGEAFYKKYAHHVGFSVRKAPHHKGNDGILVWKRFVCSRQGWRKEKENVNNQGEKSRRKVKITRVGCEAMIAFKRREDGKYVVARFVQSHTHMLVSPKKRHLLKSNREVSSEVRAALFACHKACIGTSATFRLLCAEMGGHENVGCTKQDLKNYERDFKQAISRGDGHILIFDRHDEDGASRKNYAIFGDVISFDSTYRSNRYETALEEQRQIELLNDNATMHSDPELETPWCIESHARDIYTHAIFSRFQDEVIAARDKCDIQSMFQVGDERTTMIRDNSGKVREVRYNTCTKEAYCSCKLFESIGILCCHIILVLKGIGCNEIPSHYVLHRWTKMATSDAVFDANGKLLEGSCTSLAPSSKKLYSETWSKFKTGMHIAKNCEENLKYFHKCISDAVNLMLNTGQSSENSKVQEFEFFVGATFPDEISIYPPEVAHTKGNGRRLKRASEVSSTNQSKKRARNSKKTSESYKA